MILATLVPLAIRDVSWALPLSFPSKVTPRNLTESTQRISTPCNEMFRVIIYAPGKDYALRLVRGKI